MHNQGLDVVRNSLSLSEQGWHTLKLGLGVATLNLELSATNYLAIVEELCVKIVRVFAR